MSIEGGAFICYQHEYETTSVKAWDKHLVEKFHPLEVSQQCDNCKEWNVKADLPHPERFIERMHSGKPQDQNLIVLKCQYCGKMCKT